MLGLSANLNYYLFNGNVDLRKGIFRLCESIREEMSLDPSDASNVYMFMSRNRKVVKILHYERGFMCFTKNVLLWANSRNLYLMKSPGATGYSGRTWLILRKAL
ncbi:IS66 Orf2 family protein [Bacteroides ovatus]|nr:transposase [Bacteroides ovatus]SPU14856.1 IS66 Orf2 family protein [Bacteroides ovatus]